MSSYRIRIGRAAEGLAANELKKRGYDIIETNYRCRLGEIDIIAKEGNCLVFVEVRCKRTLACGTPAESINELKRHKIINVAQIYLDELTGWDGECRFDVVEVVVASSGNLIVRDIIKDAFFYEED